MTEPKYEKWIAFNPGDAVPEGMVQLHLLCQTRGQADDRPPIDASRAEWDHHDRSSSIIAYRRLIEPVRAELVLHWNKDGSASPKEYPFDTHSLTLTMLDGELPRETYTAPSGTTIVVGMV